MTPEELAAIRERAEAARTRQSWSKWEAADAAGHAFADREALLAEVSRLRAGIAEMRDFHHRVGCTRVHAWVCARPTALLGDEAAPSRDERPKGPQPAVARDVEPGPRDRSR